MSFLKLLLKIRLGGRRINSRHITQLFLELLDSAVQLVCLHLHGPTYFCHCVASVKDPSVELIAQPLVRRLAFLCCSC